MKRIVIHGPGGYDRLQLEEHPDPTPGPGEVLVRTHAAGVNYADICIRWGVYESAKKYVGWPITPGFEFSGHVQACGPGVTRFAPGQKVFGVTRFNAYASQVVVPEHQLYSLPPSLTLDEAAGFPTVFLTAYHALFQNVYWRPGMTALVHSAAGGVGSALLQLARVAGVRTIAVVGAPHKIAYARECGADLVIDKSSEDLWSAARQAAPNGYDLIFDANGPTTLRESYRHLRPTGKLLAYGFHGMLPREGAFLAGRMNYLKAAWGLLRLPRFNALQMTNENKSLVCFNLSFLFDRRDLLEEALRALLAWVENGKIKAPKVNAFPVNEAARAHRALESGQSVGKLILTFPQD